MREFYNIKKHVCLKLADHIDGTLQFLTIMRIAGSNQDVPSKVEDRGCSMGHAQLPGICDQCHYDCRVFIWLERISKR